MMPELRTVLTLMMIKTHLRRGGEVVGEISRHQGCCWVVFGSHVHKWFHSVQMGGSGIVPFEVQHTLGIFKDFVMTDGSASVAGHKNSVGPSRGR